MAEESKKGYSVNHNSKTLKSSIDEGKSSTSSGTAKKVLVKSADMKEDMQKEAIDCAILAIKKHGVEKDIAEYIKKEFDKKHGPTWHCIVGRNFDQSSIAVEDGQRMVVSRSKANSDCTCACSTARTFCTVCMQHDKDGLTQ